MRTIAIIVLVAGLIIGCSDNSTGPANGPTVYGSWQANFTAIYLPCIDCPEGDCSEPDTVDHVSTVTLGNDGSISVTVEPPCWGAPFSHCTYGREPFEQFDGSFRLERGILKIVRDPSEPDVTEDYQLRVTADSLFLTPVVKQNGGPDIYIVRTSGILWGDAFLQSPPFERMSE